MQSLRKGRRGLSVTISLLVLVAMTAMAPVALAADRVDAPELTEAQLETFKTGAREVAGLSNAQIKRALKDPVALQSIPVKVRVVTNHDKTGVVPDAGLTATYGKTASVTLKYYNVFNIRLASFKLSKYWEYNYSTVTSAPAPWVTASVTGTGAATGWEYKGIIGETDYYYTWNGVWHGGHKSYRQGKFTTCIIKIGCWQSKQPWISIYGHYDGSWSYSYSH